MSWAAHEFELYFIQKHVGAKASFLAVVVGTQLPDAFTKTFVYAADDPAAFHRGWPGVGFSHSLLFGVLFAAVVLAITKSRAWALGLLIGQWAHVLTDFADTAGVMLFFPFSTEPVTISMWKHAAVEGRYGDAAAYYSSLGGVWDFFWLLVTVVFAWRTLTPAYFREVVVPADPRVWGWLHRTFRLPERGLLLLYQGLMFYGVGRMISWFLYARFDAQTPFQPQWGGPAYIEGNDISDSGWVEVLVRTGIGAALFVAFMWLCWRAFGRRLWERGYDVPAAVRGPGLHAIFDLPSSQRRKASADATVSGG
ncbi:metal-dependent hydrolase [Phytoactinopolyspora halotolerans]|uniref:Metal-dependent hydrolase n=1 Tax=Phytoactinopolyspora halotolerans TaxID=1981512 RepID=A0A6L9S550_9ACTN|nr:metal-dependent hydrolase [Phytoactinopolyspora halotolerans]NEE00286.1 metal-dependent hydrolase [Phytoactinopolyspora halotolerans]